MIPSGATRCWAGPTRSAARSRACSTPAGARRARAERRRRPAGNLVFELPEAALLHDLNTGRAFADQLGELGCGLSLDDLGNGIGGFAYLRRICVQTLKIDIDFIRELPDRPANQHLVQAIVALGRSYEIETIAGGVEDLDTLALLRDFGVDYAQGYAINDVTPVARRVVPLSPPGDEDAVNAVSDRALLLRGRLLDHREALRLSSVPGLVEVARMSG